MFPSKRVKEILDYDFDFTPSLLQDESVINAEITISPAGLTKKDTVISGGIVKIFLESGISGETYTITVYATTSGGRKYGLIETVNITD